MQVKKQPDLCSRKMSNETNQRSLYMYTVWQDNRNEDNRRHFDHQMHKLLMLTISYISVYEIFKLALRAFNIFFFMSDFQFQS